MHIYALIVIALSQCVAIFFVNVLVNEFSKQEYIRTTVLLVIVAIFVAIDFYFLLNRIIVLRHLLNQEPVPCSLEDILFIDYQDNGRKKYVPFPIVRSLKDHKLYLTYGKYSLMNFNTMLNNVEKSFGIYKADGSPVQLGQRVDMYMLKEVRIPITINQDENIITLKGRKVYFQHVNNQLDIEIFNTITFFKGTLDFDMNAR